MAKFCSNCGKELDDNAAICLNCGVIVENKDINAAKKGKKKGLPVWAIILIIVGCIMLLPVIFITVLVGIVFFAVDDTDFDVDEYIEESVIQRGNVGDTLTIDDFRITLTDAVVYDYIDNSEYYNALPAEGNEYLVLFFDVENITDENIYISSYDFDGYVDGYATSKEYFLNDVNGIEELNVNLPSGRKAKGYVAFEVDKTWNDFEISYNSLIYDAELVFNVVNESSDNNVQGA